MPARVLSVGQCDYDHGQIDALLHNHFAAETVPAADAAEALALLRSDAFTLVLVNRLFDENHAPGLDFIDQIKRDPTVAGIPIMLVSNFEDAQAAAQAKGALPGFGKAALNKPETLRRLAAVLGSAV